MMSKKLYVMVCNCDDVEYEYNYNHVYYGCICAYCNGRFRKKSIKTMKQQMLMIPELAIRTTQTQTQKTELNTFPSIELSILKRTYYSYNSTTGKVSKKKQRIVSEDKHKTLDTYEFMMRNK